MTLWGGRFTGETDRLMREMNDSYRFDCRLFGEDITGSIAYAEALHLAGVLTGDEQDAIISGLHQVLEEFQSGVFSPAPSDEDIHTAIERRLHEIIGTAALKLHTGRSRNDQVTTDLRLAVMAAIDRIGEHLLALQRVIIVKAEQHLGVIMPGYTHRQPAQPLLFSHWLMRYFWMIQRDRERFRQARARAATCPLGSGALAGIPFAIDRESLAERLGMSGISENSIDAVSDRDFMAEFHFNASLLGIHLSQFAEDLILFSGPESGFILLDEAYTTGSSLMPQKRNPDSLELLRGKSGRLIGHLAGILTLLKGLPSAYNKDLQEDKEGFFDACDQLVVLLPVITGVITTLTIDAGAMERALSASMLATDMADILVDQGLPFREAHAIAGHVVLVAEKGGTTITGLSREVLVAIHPLLAAWAEKPFTFAESVNRRRSAGGTAEDSVKAQIAQASRLLEPLQAS